MGLFPIKELARMWKEKGKGRTLHFLTEGFERGDFKPEDFSIRDMAYHLIKDGREYVDGLDPRRKSHVTEDASWVDTSAFSSINRQIIFSAIQDSMSLETHSFLTGIPNPHLMKPFDMNKVNRLVCEM